MKKTASSNREILYKEILNKIQYCEWVPGMLISETMLSEMFGISRTPIREALFVLAQEGFVDIFPQAGSYVSKIDLKRIQELLFLRYHLELPILRRMAEQKAQIPDSIDRLLLLMDYEASRENWKETVSLDYSIHEELICSSGHQYIWNIIKGELPHFTRFRFFEPHHNEFKGDRPRVPEEHSQILQCIREGNVERLETLMKSHYDYTLELRKEYNMNRINLHPEYFSNLQILNY